MSVLIELIDEKYSIIQVTFLATLVAIVCLTPIIFIQRNTLVNISWGSLHIWLSLLYLGIVSTAIAFFLWNKGLVLFHSPTSGLFFLFQPIVGTLLGSAQRILSCFFLVNMLRMYILAAFASFQKYVMMP